MRYEFENVKISREKDTRSVKKPLPINITYLFQLVRQIRGMLSLKNIMKSLLNSLMNF